MIEQVEIALSKKAIDALENVQEIRKELLLSDLENNVTSITQMLSNYYFESRGRVFDLKIEENSIFFEDQLTGHLKIHFSLNYFMGCQDLTYDDKGSMKIQFKVNPQDKIIKLIGEDIRERDPDQY